MTFKLFINYNQITNNLVNILIPNYADIIYFE